ncbi:alpha-glucosidase [Enterococcus thailandicus]|uniref:glycoside hydrolase family 13 protein n=1 Tax=Enterococcus thailandicus TaxID=417368 RepID=UPI0022EBA563|nr:alpha-glucosidase [Enterococcus thailandicus]MDA3972882.1 alpha-glucosidase [Enterococcus thailandicus]MDA3975684.1 alpha-glucosidase [Enterococcus thailandicus]MDA3980342.1 alpha-glucosidase [Enterococcus thailandicus]
MEWWKKAVFYQVYPMSFQDSNGDGIGDIQGIINRLDYLQDLGIGAIWLSPVYKSPNDDNGYDISDYHVINPEYGTMNDMENLISEAKKRNILIVMDLVVNHTSDEHDWFQESRKSKDNPYRDFYIWRDPASDGGAPNDLESNFKGSAWEYDELTGQYYLHFYSKKQPDLNWGNPKVRQAIYDMMNWWLEKGIGGFRMDVIDLIGKVPDEKVKENGPKLHDYIQEMNRETFSKYDVVTVGETWGATPEIAKLYSNPKRHELSMIFQFEQINLDKQPGKSRWDLRPLIPRELHEVFSKWQSELSEEGWNSLFWSNHDLPRVVSRWGSDTIYREKSAKALAIYLHMLKGTPYIYQGEEIGMTNYPVTSIEEVKDIESIGVYNDRLKQGFSPESIIEGINAKGRDNARHPIQWTAGEKGGFTTGIPWLPVHPNHTVINVESEVNDEHSVLATYKKLISLRKTESILVTGTFKVIETNSDSVLSYLRDGDGKRWLVLVNLSKEMQDYQLSLTFNEVNRVISNTDTSFKNTGTLAPYDAMVVEVN